MFIIAVTGLRPVTGLSLCEVTGPSLCAVTGPSWMVPGGLASPVIYRDRRSRNLNGGVLISRTVRATESPDHSYDR